MNKLTIYDSAYASDFLAGVMYSNKKGFDKYPKGWISVEETPPDPEYDDNLLIWMKTPSGRGKAHVASFIDTDDESYWYNSDYPDHLIGKEEVTHYAYIVPPLKNIVS